MSTHFVTWSSRLQDQLVDKDDNVGMRACRLPPEAGRRCGAHGETPRRCALLRRQGVAPFRSSLRRACLRAAFSCGKEVLCQELGTLLW